jgi:hypothetical protein
VSRRTHWTQVLSEIPGTPLTDVLGRRLVKRELLESGDPPDFLFTSGRPARFNPRGIIALCLS